MLFVLKGMQSFFHTMYNPNIVHFCFFFVLSFHFFAILLLCYLLNTPLFAVHSFTSSRKIKADGTLLLSGLGSFFSFMIIIFRRMRMGNTTSHDDADDVDVI